MGVSGFHGDFYAQWRSEVQARLLLREGDGSGPPPERLLQALWHHQRLRRDSLRTLDGKSLRILHPGFWNRESGPDFRGAVVQFDQAETRSGDIEIDMAPRDWRGHSHNGNPAFANVILHVVWNSHENAAGAIPSMALEDFLDAPIADLRGWIGSEAAQGWPDELLGECCGPLRGLSPEAANELLLQAARLRLRRKAYELEARARQAGWEQALWEGLFRALGYKQNVWPMQRLAELLPALGNKGDSLLLLQARAFGIGGLLPGELNATSNPRDPYLRTLWDHWWREREKFSDLVLPKPVWRFNGLRPANHPQRRLALATHWLGSGELFSQLERWFTTQNRPLENSLLDCLQPAADDFWSWHWTFRSPRLSKPQPLLGPSRLTDLAINVILPWFWIRAHAGKNRDLEQVAEERYFAWPAAQDNSLLKLARQRLFGQGTLRWLNTAAAQQGMLQIVRDCCEHSNSICAECPFPDLVRSWTRHRAQTKEPIK